MKTKQWIGYAALALLSLVGVWAETTRPDLLGRVVREDGTPVTNATVFIYSAAPKQGTGALCPSCYADCAKTAKTAADGTFIIESLDPDLIFRLLVVAPGCESTFVGKTDPAEGRKEIDRKSVV